MRARISATVLVFLMASIGLHAETNPIAPDAVDGLIAWYDARSLYDKLRDREAVTRWPDASGNGHDLTEEGKGLASVFRALQQGEKPAIKVGKLSSFAVASPFTLDDHTIFLVYRSTAPTLALFSAARNDQSGVVVAMDDKHHLIQAGNEQSRYNAAGAGSSSAAFSITVLARESGRLRAYVDGVDVSGEAHDGSALEVGRLFHVSLSRAVSRDAEGMRVADLIFYGRQLTDGERNGVTAYLAEKYALELREAPAAERAPAFDWSGAEPQASLSTSLEANLNVDGLALTWDTPERLDGPFRFDAEEPSRLYVKRDGRIHLSVRLWLRTSGVGTQLRLLVLRNENDYRLDSEAVTRPDPDEPAGTRLTGRLDTSLDMQAGDWVEIVVTRDGADGSVSVVPGESVVLAVAD